MPASAGWMDRARGRPYFAPFMNEQNRLATQTFTAWADAFTPAELDAIERFGDSLVAEKAVVLAESPEGSLQDRIRVTRAAWIEQVPETKWLYDRLQGVIRSMNDQSYRFDLRGFSEHFQYTVYHGNEGGHYEWHVDHGPLHVQRKLSVSVQLSDPASYEGCDLEFCAGTKVVKGPRERGAIIAFPSYVLHRVTPVTSGTRKSLVVWTTGPNFR